MAKEHFQLKPGRFGPRQRYGRPRNGGLDALKILGTFVGVAAIGAVGLGAYYASLTFKEIAEIQTLDIRPTAIDFTPAPEVTETVEIEPVDPVQDRTVILLVGSDSRKGLSKEQLARIGTKDDGSDLTDTIILTQLDPKTDRIAMLSFPRDLVVRRCDGTRGRINEAWYIGTLQDDDGGAACLVQTVEQLSGIRVDHLMRVNFAGFVNVVDTLGGVDFAVDQDMKDRWSGLDIKEGCNHFDGIGAIQFVRARHIDSDFGRQARQQRFAKEMIKKTTSLGTLSNPAKVTGLISSASDAVETDTGLGAGKLFDIAWSMRNVNSESLVAYSIPAEVGRLGEASVLFMNDNEAEQIFDAFRTGILVEQPAVTETPVASNVTATTNPSTGVDSGSEVGTPSSSASASTDGHDRENSAKKFVKEPDNAKDADELLQATGRFAGSWDPGISCS